MLPVYKPGRLDWVDALILVLLPFTLFGLLVSYWLVMDWWF